jgi:glucuronate isomerase
MTTDSRSVFSFVRHDYFRRVLCEWVSEMVKKERLPNDYNLLSDLILKVCYKNAKKITGGK